MKKKLFYASLVVFFGAFVSGALCGSAYAAELSEEDKAAIKEIEENNRLQEENKMTLQKYHQKNPNSMTAQDDEYWDLAWHARLADAGDEDSQYIIAQAYERGKDVDTNPQKAVAFYQRACDQGHVDACMRLGAIYLENKWLQKDEDKALYWYVKAAKQGYTPAQFKVASLYEERQDFDAAYKWTEQAVKNLFPDAADLTEHAPQLMQLKKDAGLQAKMAKRGVDHLRLHESFLTPLSARRLR